MLWRVLFRRPSYLLAPYVPQYLNLQLHLADLLNMSPDAWQAESAMIASGSQSKCQASPFFRPAAGGQRGLATVSFGEANLEHGIGVAQSNEPTPHLNHLHTPSRPPKEQSLVCTHIHSYQKL